MKILIKQRFSASRYFLSQTKMVPHTNSYRVVCGIEPIKVHKFSFNGAYYSRLIIHKHAATTESTQHELIVTYKSKQRPPLVIRA